MAQKLFDDKIGNLTHAGGTITIAPSIITVGGQQYRTTSPLSRPIVSDVVLAANSLYMVFAVLVSGVVELRISSNVNSVGPSGFAAWKLVGAFYSNGNSPIAFGSFVNIKGPAATANEVTGVGSVLGVTNQSTLYRWARNSRNINIEFLTVFSAAPSVFVSFNADMPQNIMIDLSGILGGVVDARQSGIVSIVDAATAKYDGFADINSAVSVRALVQGVGGTYEMAANITNTIPIAFNVADTVNVRFFSLPILGWDNRSIEDL